MSYTAEQAAVEFSKWWAKCGKNYPRVKPEEAQKRIRTKAKPIDYLSEYFHQVCGSLRPGQKAEGDFSGPADEAS